MSEYATHEELGRLLAESIDTLETQRKFAGDMEYEFVIPLDDGTEYEVIVRRKP